MNFTLPRLWRTIACIALIAGSNRESTAESGVPEGFMIIEGDVLVPEDFFTRGTYATNLWLNAVIPYEFDANVSSAQQSIAISAMQRWESAATVDFRPRAGEFNFIHIGNDAASNYSLIGMWDLPGQPVQINSWDEWVVAHELAHALGFWHEQSRADRDTYVTINWDIIQPGMAFNFDIRGDQGPQGSGEYGPYDFDSIMHYGACDFSICCTPGFCPCAVPGCRTIILNPPYQGMVIGQMSHLSDWDKITMSFLYPRPDWRFVDVAATGAQTGSFVQPYHQFAPGYGNTPSGGTLWIQPGTYLAGGTHSIPMTIAAPLGGVVLGN